MPLTTRKLVKKILGNVFSKREVVVGKLMNMTDEEILILSYTSPRAFGELFNRYNKRFSNIARKVLGSKDEAEDIVQDTFVKIYKYGKSFDGEKGDFKTWSNAILSRSIADHLRKLKSSEVSLTDELENVLESEDGVEERRNLNFIESILSKMGKATREIIQMRFISGKSYKEIGKLLGVTSATARVRIYRAKKIFSETYEKLNSQSKYHDH